MFNDPSQKTLYKNHVINILSDNNEEYFVEIDNEFIGSFNDPILAMETAYSTIDCEE